MIFRSASIGVEFFFILSGYLMATNADAQEVAGGAATWRYIWKKAKGIYPYYFCGVFLELLGGVLRNSAYTLKDVPYMIWDILFLRVAGLQGPKINMLVGASWYLSAMLLAMWILYPVALRFKDMFLKVIAPLLAIFIMGSFSNLYGNIRFQLDFENGICLGLLRAIAELCVGCTCYAICKSVKEMEWGTAGRVLITGMEVLPMCGVIYIARYIYRSQTDFICILLIALGVIAAFSGKSYTMKLFSHCNLDWVGPYSLALYLTHCIWVRNLDQWKLSIPYRKQVVILVILSLVTAAACMWTCRLSALVAEMHRKNTNKGTI